MTKKRTLSEHIFEQFLTDNGIRFERIPEGAEKRPDYSISLSDDSRILFEVKELRQDDEFSTEPFEVSTRTPGEHIRKKIADARGQVKFGAKQGIPSVLLIYNNIDPMHLFGTEDLDFLTAMKGELTLQLDKHNGRVGDFYHGRNQSFREDTNTAFSAVGRLWPVDEKMRVMLFENIHADVKIAYNLLPPCFEIMKV